MRLPSIDHWKEWFCSVNTVSSYKAELPSVRSLNRSFTLSLITDAMDCYLKKRSIQKELLRLYYSWTVSVLVQFESEVKEARRANKESLYLTK